MHVTYKPEDGDRQEWDFNPGRVPSSVAATLQKAYGGTWDEFENGVKGNDVEARRVMLWHLMRLEHPTVQLRDVPDFCADELEVAFSVAELIPMREKLLRTDMPESKREQALAVIDREIDEAREREEAQGGGKASSRTPSTNGGSSSPQSFTYPPGESATRPSTSSGKPCSGWNASRNADRRGESCLTPR